MLPFVAVELQGDERRYLHDGFDLREVMLGLGRLELLQRGLFGGVGAECVLVGAVGRGPESVLQRKRVVVGGGELDGAVATAAAAVDGIVADADGDADDALVVGLLASERAVVGDGLVGVDVVEAVLDEVGSLHAGEQEAFFTVELLLHGAEEWVVYLRGRFCGRDICNYSGAKEGRRAQSQGERLAYL